MTYTVAHDSGTWVTTADGPIHLEQGDPLPEGIHPDEVARLANGGVLEGLAQEPELVGGDVERGQVLPAGKVEDIKTRVGSDVELARAYLEQEQAADKPRATLVEHLEQVIADAEHRTDPGTPPAGVRDSGEGED